MGSFLSNESTFGRLTTKIGTIVVINILFAVSCVPFFTVGAAMAAMYSALFELVRAEEEDKISRTGAEINPFRAYVRGLRRCGIRATLLWLGFIGIMGLGSINLQICAGWTGLMRGMWAAVVAVMIFASIMIIFLLPVLASSGEEQLPLRGIPALAVRAAISRPLRSLTIVLLNIVPLVLIALDEPNRPTYAFIGTFFGFALIAYMICRMLLPVLRTLQRGGTRPASAPGPNFLVRMLQERKARKYLM